MKNKKNARNATTERVARLKKDFYKIRTEHPEMKISEIAKKYGVATRTIYDNLQDIAEKNGVPRETLLKFPHQEHPSRPAVNRIGKVNSDELEQNMDKLIKDVGNLTSELQNIIENNKTFLQQEENTHEC